MSDLIQRWANGALVEQWDEGARTYATYNPDGTVKAARPYTATENAAADAAVSRDAASTNDADLRTKASQALTVNATFLALAAPTNAQTTAQVKALTRETSALIRLTIRALDTVTGT